MPELSSDECNVPDLPMCATNRPSQPLSIVQDIRILPSSSCICVCLEKGSAKARTRTTRLSISHDRAAVCLSCMGIAVPCEPARQNVRGWSLLTILLVTRHAELRSGNQRRFHGTSWCDSAVCARGSCESSVGTSLHDLKLIAVEGVQVARRILESYFRRPKHRHLRMILL